MKFRDCSCLQTNRVQYSQARAAGASSYLCIFVSVCHVTLRCAQQDTRFLSPLAHSHLWFYMKPKLKHRRKLKKQILCLEISNGNPWNASQEHPLKFECHLKHLSRLVALLPQACGSISKVSDFKGCRYPEFDTELGVCSPTWTITIRIQLYSTELSFEPLWQFSSALAHQQSISCCTFATLSMLSFFLTILR